MGSDNGWSEFHLRLKPKDRRRLEMITGLYDMSVTAAMRMCIRAASRELGLEEGNAEDFLTAKRRRK
jgi:hypothetical protein